MPRCPMGWVSEGGFGVPFGDGAWAFPKVDRLDWVGGGFLAEMLGVGF
jgi:hypothetical protein